MELTLEPLQLAAAAPTRVAMVPRPMARNVARVDTPDVMETPNDPKVAEYVDAIAKG